MGLLQLGNLSFNRSFAPPPPAGPTLVLWNKMESASGGLIPSEVGPDIHQGNGSFYAAKFGNGVKDDGASYPYITGAELDSILTTPLKGCIEFWLKATAAFGSNYAYISGIGSGSNSEYLLIAGDIDGNPGHALYANVLKSSSWPYDMLVYGLPAVSAGDFIHMAITWDFVDGIDGSSDTARLYIDGGQVDSSTSANSVSSFTGITFGLGRNWTTAAKAPAMMDNLKIWDGPKIDFSDRNSE